MKAYAKQRYRRSLFSSGGGPSQEWLTGRVQGRIDYEQAVGDGTQSDIAMACVNWLMRVFPEPPIVLEEKNAEDEWEIISPHPLIERLEQPNPAYEGDLMLVATELSFALDGNAYWWIIPSNGGQVAEIWWLPHQLVEPKGREGDNRVYIDHYEFSPEGTLPIRIEVEDMVHFRFGIDPQNVRKGLSPVRAVLREAYTDREASEWISGLMDNSGLPWAVLSPDPNAEMQSVQEDLLATRTYIENQLKSGRPGGVLALGAPVRLEPVTITPRQMNFKDIRRIPEERISANLGVPPIVASLGAGLDRATYANYQVAEKVAYRSTLMPTYKTFARVIRRNMLSRYEDNIEDKRLRFDLSEVEALQEDENEIAGRVRDDFAAGLIMLSEARAERGWPVDDNMRVYLRPSGVTEVREEDVGKEPEPNELETPPDESEIEGEEESEERGEEEEPEETPKAGRNGRAKQMTSSELLSSAYSEPAEYWKPFFSEN